MMRANYVCSDSEDKVMKGCLAKGYFQDEGKGCEASARSQVYLSKTKLKLQVVSSCIYSRSTIGVDESEWSKGGNGES